MRLWDFARSAYARPGVAAACLQLQDEHGQCVVLLLWRIWTLAERRPVGGAALDAAVATSRAWEMTVVSPLREVRRQLRHGFPLIADAARAALRDRVEVVERAAERALLEALEARAASMPGDDPDWSAALAALVVAWDPAIPADALAPLLDAIGPLAADGGSDTFHAMNDERAGGETEAEIRLGLAQLRQAHQDLDDAVAALEAGPQPDQLQIARLKKKKLVLRDQIAKLDNRLTPDIIA